MSRIFLILGLKERLMVLDVYVRFGVMYDFRSEDMGSNGVKMEFFESFSRSVPGIILILGLKERFMVVDVCVRFGGQTAPKIPQYQKSFELLYIWLVDQG